MNTRTLVRNDRQAGHGRRTEQRNRHCTEMAKNVKCQQDCSCPHNCRAIPGWNHSQPCTTTTPGDCPGTADDDQGHPRCRDHWFVSENHDFATQAENHTPQDRCRQYPRPAARLLHDRETERQTDAQSSMSILVAPLDLESLSRASFSPRVYGRTEEKTRSPDPTRSRHAYAWCPLCAIFAPSRPSKIFKIQPGMMRGPRNSSLTAARCSIQSESTYHPVSRALGTAGERAIHGL